MKKSFAEKIKHFYINGISRYDPTRTTMLRRAFVADMMMRFNRLKVDIRKSVDENDCFALSRRPMAFEAIEKRKFDFPRSSDKITAFMGWLNEQEKVGILEVTTRPGMELGMEGAWTDKYIQTAYQKGIIRSRQELRKAGYDVQLVDETFGGISTAFNQPFHIDRVGLLYTRTFSDLKGITSAMDQQISRVLAQGIAEGRNPRELARILNDRVEKIGKTRARALARTEIIRAHTQAAIQEYRQFGIEGVTVRAEWLTAGYNVCGECADYEGKVFSLDVIEGMIPAHPN